MQLLTLIQRTPRRVIFAFVFSYGCTLALAVLLVFKPAQMFWQ